MQNTTFHTINDVCIQSAVRSHVDIGARLQQEQKTCKVRRRYLLCPLGFQLLKLYRRLAIKVFDKEINVPIALLIVFVRMVRPSAIETLLVLQKFILMAL